MIHCVHFHLVVTDARDNRLTGSYFITYGSTLVRGSLGSLREITKSSLYVSFLFFTLKISPNNVIDQQYRFPRDIAVGYDGISPPLAAGETVCQFGAAKSADSQRTGK